MRFLLTGDYNKNTVRKTTAVFFLSYIVIHWLTNLLLFYFKLGFTPAGVSAYYLGNEELFMPARTFMGMLEVTHYHLFGAAIVLYTITHFVTLTEIKNSTKLLLIWGCYASSLLDILSGWLILYVSPVFSYLKLLSFFTFEIAVILVLWTLIYHLLSDPDKKGMYRQRHINNHNGRKKGINAGER